MAEGKKVILYTYDPSTGTLVMAEDSEHLAGLTTTDEIECTTAGVTVATITTGFKGYVTFLSAYNSSEAEQTFELADTGGTKRTISIPAGETETIISENPFIVLVAGAVTGTAGTGNHIKVCMTYFEREE